MFGPRFIHEDRHRLYRELRLRHGPVVPVTLLGDIPAWLVLGYRELRQVLDDPELFSSDSRIWNQWDVIPDDWPLIPMVGRHPSIHYDGGERHRLRSKLLGDALEEVDPTELRDHAERLADRLIDTFCARGEADLITEYTQLLPALVLARLYGFRDEDIDEVVSGVNALVNSVEGAHEGRERVQRAMGELLRSRGESPGPDVATRMQAHPHSAEFTSVELLEDLMVAMVAGHQPTCDWMGNSLRLMLTDDRFAASLTGGRHSVPEAMNEVLWEDTPSENVPGRWATRDAHLAGRRIARGDMLISSYAGANADPQIRPDTGTLAGGNSSFLSFSHGSHRCPYPAQEIAEGIARTGIEVLLDRLPDVDLAVEPQELVWRPTPLLRGLESLPVVFTPNSAVGP